MTYFHFFVQFLGLKIFSLNSKQFISFAPVVIMYGQK